MPKKKSSKLTVEAITHDDAKRKNIPTAELQPVVRPEDQKPVSVTLPRNSRGLETEKQARYRDLDPQLVWKGKDDQDWSDLVVQAPPIYIQEKVHPKHLIDDLVKRTERVRTDDKTPPDGNQLDLFADFNGLPSAEAKTEFYQHEGHWQNRMILGDSLQVMASLAEREGLRGKVQCVYFDPPYGIRFNSNFQWSTTSRDVKDGNVGHITREPEQVKAFRDTWRDGIHSYLTYIRDRLTAARDLLTESGSIFVQIGDENVHRVRAVMDEIFGDHNHVSAITVQKTGGQTTDHLACITDYCLWYAKDIKQLKYRQLYNEKIAGEGHGSGERYNLIDERGRNYRWTPTVSNRPPGSFPVPFQGTDWLPSGGYWKTNEVGFSRLIKANRIGAGRKTLQYRRFLEDFPAYEISNVWTDVAGTSGKIYVVQTATSVVERCLLMATDPGDLVLDPTCGSGTTAAVAEQWGRRWITIDTSRVALALARARIMGSRFQYYLLVDSQEGREKEATITKREPSSQPVLGSVRHGFVYQRIPHVTLKSIANNSEIDVISETWNKTIEPLRIKLGAALNRSLQEWEIPREPDTKWSDATKKLHAEWLAAWDARQKAIDASITAKAEFELLFDRPYENKRKVRVAGPFTVESLSPHRMLGVDEDGGLIDPHRVAEGKGYGVAQTFTQMIIENLKSAGVQQAHKEDRIVFTALTGWPGTFCCTEGRFMEGDREKRAAIFIGPEFGTVSRPDLVEAAREAADGGFDVLIACAFNFDAHAGEFQKLGRIPVLKARMNADLHMAGELKNTGKGNLFVIFGEPDVSIWKGGSPEVSAEAELAKKRRGELLLEVQALKMKKDRTQNDAERLQAFVRQLDRDERFVAYADKIPLDRHIVEVRGVDVFDPSTGEVRSDNADQIACWFIDTDYNGESFFVRHAYFLGQNDPYKALKTTLKAEIDPEVWATLNSDTSRPFVRPVSGRIAVKVINHLGDEVMKVFKV